MRSEHSAGGREPSPGVEIAVPVDGQGRHGLVHPFAEHRPGRPVPLDDEGVAPTADREYAPGAEIACPINGQGIHVCEVFRARAQR